MYLFASMSCELIISIHQSTQSGTSVTAIVWTMTGLHSWIQLYYSVGSPTLYTKLISEHFVGHYKNKLLVALNLLYFQNIQKLKLCDESICFSISSFEKCFNIYSTSCVKVGNKLSNFGTP